MFVQLYGPKLVNLKHLKWMRVDGHYKMGLTNSRIVIKTKDLNILEIQYTSPDVMQADVEKIRNAMVKLNKSTMNMDNYLICLDDVVSFNFRTMNDRTLTIVMTDGETQDIEFSDSKTLDQNYVNMSKVLL